MILPHKTDTYRLKVGFTLLICFLFISVASSQTTITSQISNDNDDAEEELSNGEMDRGSSDLELIRDGSTNQLVGLRFQDINIPQGTTIISATIQFTTDQTDTDATSIIIKGQNADSPGSFTNSNYDISNRTVTTASIPWNNIPAWNTEGEAGVNQRTPDLTAIVQEIVNRGGWSSGNAMAFIISGSGERTAEAYDGEPNAAAVLTITADFTPPPRAPLPAIIPNTNRGLPLIYYMADNRSELYSVAPDPTASPLPSPSITNITFGGNPITFSGEGGGYRSTDRLVYVFMGSDPSNSSDMYSIDPNTGVANLIKPNIVPGHVDGAEFYINNSTGEEVMVILYQNGTNGGSDRIMAVNPNANGASPAWSPYAGYPVSLSGERTRGDGISWDPENAEFYIQNDNNVDYYKVDITTGNTTFAFTTSEGVDGEGITYASDGNNYIEDEDRAGMGRTIFAVNTSTGTLTPAAQLGSTGDVESIMGNLGVRNDAGDAPSTYGYAAHILPILETTPLSIYLGTVPPDSEDPFVNFSIGNSDDNNGDDEDGVTSGGVDLSGQQFVVNTSKIINVQTNGSGYLNAWIDYNRDGDFDDPGEQIANDQSPSGSSINLNISIPATATAGTSYARFRYSSETGLAPGNSEAVDGEVEDYQILIYDPTVCPPGTTLVENTSNIPVYATAIIKDKGVKNAGNALGNDDSTRAEFDKNKDELVLEMGASIATGSPVTVNGGNGDDFDIWISSSATGPWTRVGNNAKLDFSFISPIDWRYISFEVSNSSSKRNLSYVEATVTTITRSCEPDNDGDGVPDRIDLDNDNDGIPDVEEANGNDPYGDEDGDGSFNWEDTVDNGNSGDGSTTSYLDGNNDGVPDVYDSDLDGIPNHLDLDSDNDGIYDAVEAGHNQPHTNGVVNSGYGSNGLANIVETSPESGVINYSLNDTDGDTTPDYMDEDSDGDGCNDANEAYHDSNTDADNNGMYGLGLPSVDPDGTVVGATYPMPADADGSGIYDYMEFGAVPIITAQPTDFNICPGCTGTIFVEASPSGTYQWQILVGAVWTNLTDSGVHSGVTTDRLTITNPSPSDSNNSYRVVVSNSVNVCGIATSNSATLTIKVRTVITNRRITYRVNRD